ncbi:DUF1753-domain-containing protein [Aaosphaeria arxii CBS 175.79]|uniref:DUF1753-domain-containing protein n=1 Tax=Aaosphaeria arxii CBS 175.79 TaxID=1450172 RepID=A0A6A5Y3V4_9PLEO|nr:DUF1753-domain-containing protein [Aaosphaeria arxii CBS 175.79]KAF2019959.1 DUF1753-domain-containing protein [Aaosphaeria arxii CBS 175.79]
MAPSLGLLDLPRPKTFLRSMSLRTGAEIITFLQVINKVSGLYGMLALLTGAHLSGLQLSMYLYSTIVLVLTVFLYKHIRIQSPFETLVLAHVYALDSVVNACYTAFFGLAWFYVLAQHPETAGTPGAAGISENAGFTSPKYNVSKVDIVAEPAGGLQPGQNAVAVGQPAANAGLGNAIFQSGSIMSVSLIAGFWALRVYFVFIMLAFARQCLRQHIATNSSSAAWQSTQPSNLAENPFEEGKEEGEGYKGKIGRLMMKCAPTYWLGADEGEDWMRGVGGKFRKNISLNPAPVGVNERERRRRSGTGPPAPPRELVAPQLADLQEVR